MTSPKTKKRGRPRKPITTPVAAPTTTPDDALRAMAAAAAARQAKGERLAHHEAKALRESWLLDWSLHVWRSKEAAAADLSISVGTLTGLSAQGCPGLPSQTAGDGQSPIPKAPVLAWLLRHSHERGANPPANQQSIEDQDERLRRLRADRLEGTLVAEAEDRASAALIAVCGRLRHDLLHVWPGLIVAEILAHLAAQGISTATVDRPALDAAISAIAAARLQLLPTDLRDERRAEEPEPGTSTCPASPSSTTSNPASPTASANPSPAPNASATLKGIDANANAPTAAAT